MLGQAMNVVLFAAVIVSLGAVDYILGYGLVDVTQLSICKVTCFIKRTWRRVAKYALTDPNNVSFLLLAEVILLFITRMILNKYKYVRGKDYIDELLKESKGKLRETNDFLEKSRLRRSKNWRMPSLATYLDEEPQEIKPLTLEVPILHMAIIDTLGTTRNQLERGDAGDTINITDSTLLSVTSLLDNDYRLSTETIPDDYGLDPDNDSNTGEFKNRYLWDVMEEDSNLEDL